MNEELFFCEVSDLLQKARQKTYQSINSLIVETYWQIGKRIVEQEQNGKDRANYGEYLITRLSVYLGEQLGKGFSVANLKNFRQFYLVFPKRKSYTLCSQLSWSHIRLIMRLDDENARIYYLNETKEQNWSVRQLERNIKSLYYHRLLSSKTNDKALASSPEKPGTYDYIKDPYVLEFLNLPEDIKSKESTLEHTIISNLQKFLLELGKGFSFVARQMRISTETSHFYIDLVFYNYILKCFVIIDLKTDKLAHQDIGQMDMYVRMFDDLKKGKDDNPTIGLILCADKDETIVKYSILKESQHIFASKYKTVLPSEEELAEELTREKRLMEYHTGT
jgi:predicted nuclease of restriction endonuclease-like (RecB) superfamily